MKKKIINPRVSLALDVLLDELMWPAARYCIGRHTYVSSYADTMVSIILHYRQSFDPERLAFFARDIRANVSEVVRIHDNVRLENYSNDRIVMDAYTLIAQWLEAHPGERFCDYDFDVDCEVCSVDVDRREVPAKSYGGVEDILNDYDLVHWITLANVIDRSTHVAVTAQWQGQEQTLVCVPVPDAEQVYNDAAHRVEGYRFVTRYKELKRAHTPWFVADDCITKVEVLDN